MRHAIKFLAFFALTLSGANLVLPDACYFDQHITHKDSSISAHEASERSTTNGCTANLCTHFCQSMFIQKNVFVVMTVPFVIADSSFSIQESELHSISLDSLFRPPRA